MKYSIVVPCYNESNNLQNLVNALLPLATNYDVEFVLVENGSKDNSREIFKTTIENKYSGIKVVYIDENQGYGYGIKQGIKASHGYYIGWLHADLQVSPEYFRQMFDILEKQQKEYLYLKGKRSNRHLIEYFFSYGMAFFETLLFKHIMYEVQAMPVLFKKNLVANIDEIPNDFAIDIYTYAKAVHCKYKVIHIPVKIKDRTEGKSSWNTGLVSKLKLSFRIIKGSLQIKSIIKKNA